jgi:hypothetical protein
VASAPSVGATSISVNSSTANFDIPANAGLFVQLTPQAGGGGVADGDKGDITVSSSGTVWAIDNGAVTNSKFRNSNGLTVVGRSANSSGAVADISAGTDGHVLRRSGTTLGFGQIVAAGIADGIITLAKMANITGPTVLGRSASGAGAVSELTASQLYSILSISGGGSGRIPRFSGSSSMVAGDDLKYSNNTLRANSFSTPTVSGWDSTYVTFGIGAGTGATVNSFTGGGNWAKITFTTGTSPTANNTVIDITLAQSTFSSLIIATFSAGNYNAAAQMNNFYIEENTAGSFQIKAETALPASTEFKLKFLFIGN